MTEAASVFSLRPAGDSGADGAGRGCPGYRSRAAAPAPEKAPREAALLRETLSAVVANISAALSGRVPLPGPFNSLTHSLVFGVVVILLPFFFCF